MPITKVIDEVKGFLTREDAEEYIKKLPDSLDSKQILRRVKPKYFRPR